MKDSVRLSKSPFQAPFTTRPVLLCSGVANTAAKRFVPARRQYSQLQKERGKKERKVIYIGPKVTHALTTSPLASAVLVSPLHVSLQNSGDTKVVDLHGKTSLRQRMRSIALIFNII